MADLELATLRGFSGYRRRHNRSFDRIGLLTRAWINTPRDKSGVERLKYPLAADATKTVSRDYGVLIENRGIALRGLFVIDDADGKLRSFAAGERGLDLLKASLDRVLGAANQAATP